MVFVFLVWSVFLFVIFKVLSLLYVEENVCVVCFLFVVVDFVEFEVVFLCGLVFDGLFIV